MTRDEVELLRFGLRLVQEQADKYAEEGRQRHMQALEKVAALVGEVVQAVEAEWDREYQQWKRTQLYPRVFRAHGRHPLRRRDGQRCRLIQILEKPKRRALIEFDDGVRSVVHVAALEPNAAVSPEPDTIGPLGPLPDHYEMPDEDFPLSDVLMV